MLGGTAGSELLFGKQASVTCREDGWETELRGDEEGEERRRFLRPLQLSKSLHYRFFCPLRGWACNGVIIMVVINTLQHFGFRGDKRAFGLGWSEHSEATYS